MRTTKNVLFFLGVVCVFSVAAITNGCSAAQQITKAYNLSQCSYSYDSVGELNIAGIDAMKPLSLSSLGQIGTLFTGSLKSIPLNMTVNLDVENPNNYAAAMSGLNYILSVDGVEFTQGRLEKSFEVPARSTAVLPVPISLDLAKLISSESGDAVVNIAKNLLGISDTKSKITLQVKPSITVAGQMITSPVYIPVSFQFGGQK